MNEEIQKKKRRLRQLLLLKEEESIEFQLLLRELEELAKQKKYVDLKICPKCKSPKVRRASTCFDPLGNMGIAPVKYECGKCGHQERIFPDVTNRKFTPRDLAVISDEKYGR